MVVDGNASKLVATFDADLNSTTQGLSPTESQLVLLAKQDLIFTYTFFNRGDYPYYATLNYTDSNNDDMNIDVYYKSASDAEFSMDNTTQIQVPAMVGEAVGTTTYQVKMTIHDSSFDSKMSGVFNWNLSKEKPVNVSLAYTNNTNSAINPENVTIVANEDKTQFKIVGPTPIVADSSTTNLTELTNASGSEFYYFASNSEVKDSTGYTDPGTTYYISPYSAEESASSMYTYGQGLQNMSATMASDPSQYTAKEVWYDMPAKPTIIYATFMTPNNRTGNASGGDTGDVVISHSVLSIPENAFYSSTLRSCTIPNSITSIGKLKNTAMEEFYYNPFGTFCMCQSLTSVTIPNSITSIGDFTFAGTALTSMTIPESVADMGTFVFCSCTNLTSITIPKDVTNIDGTFYGCSSLTSVIIPNNLTIIGPAAFAGCSSLTSITIPNSVMSIGANAFVGCENLTSITIPDSVTSIGREAFSGCSSLTYNILENVKYLGNDENLYVVAMGVTDKTLTSYTISNNAKFIYSNAFSGCSNLTDIIIPEGVTSIGDYAFESCSSLTGITIPNSVISVGNGVFDVCDNLSYNILDNVKYLGNISNPYVIVMGVTDTTLTSYTISSNIKYIYDNAFSGCSNLTEITIPEGVTSIGLSAFEGCSSLTSISIPESVASIGDTAFYNCTNLTSISIPYGIISIGDSAFHSCCSLVSITIPDGVMSIGNYAFYQCSNLTNVTIPNSVTFIGTYAFYQCSSLTSVTIGSRVAIIGREAFEYCYNLLEVYNLSKLSITAGSNGYGNVGYYAKVIHTSLSEESIIKEVDDYQCYAYNGEYGLLGYKGTSIELILPENLEGNNYIINQNAFRNCSNLISVTIPDSVTSIGSSAFYNCSKLTDVYYDGTESEWNSITIGSSNTPLVNATKHYLYGWTLVSVQTEATCTEDGVKIYEKNGVQKQVAIPKLGHSWNENDICDRCGSTKPIPQYTIAKTSGASYEFVESSGVYTSNNKGKDSSTASSTLTALNDCEITITWTVSSESNWDKLTITVNGTTQVNEVSGEKSDSFTVSLSAGDKIEFKYTKDSSSSSGSDCATFTISY